MPVLAGDFNEKAKPRKRGDAKPVPYPPTRAKGRTVTKGETTMPLDRARAAAHRREQKLAEEKRATYIFTSILIFACVLLGFIVMNYSPLSSKAILPDAEGEPQAISSLYMASKLCRRQADISHRGKTVDAVTDDLSTRYDDPRDMFIVLLMVSVYEPAKMTMEYRVHCHVIPRDTVVSYFKSFVVEA